MPFNMFEVTQILWGRERQSTLVFLLGKSQGLRSLVGYSPCDRKELDTTEPLTHTHTHTHTHKGEAVTGCGPSGSMYWNSKAGLALRNTVKLPHGPWSASILFTQ